ncbi:branched-chain amino acid ABC transporter permease [Natroniella sp. ANB-PHB2]|uniref:branched-chain amino acid ABC transporter permease n=1 Tax=Natroniella sp. ANB-PHB2 TaxID=3384444 RepID=UPI0038D3EF10
MKLKNTEIKRSTLFVIILAILIPPVLQVPNYLMSTINMILIYSMVAVGMNLLLGFAGQISLGHAAFVAIGAYTSAFVTMDLGLPFLVGLLAAIIVTAFFGFLLGIPALKLEGHYLAIATLGFGVAVYQILINWSGFSGGSRGRTLLGAEIFGFNFNTHMRSYYLALVLLLVMIFLVKNLLDTKSGRALIALRDSPIAARTVGVDTAYYKTVAFIISAIFAGVAGVVYAHSIGYISPYEFELLMSIDFFVMVIIGGIASIKGSIYGAIFMVMIPELFSRVRNVPLIIMGLAIVLIVHFAPRGIVELEEKLASKIKGITKTESGGESV